MKVHAKCWRFGSALASLLFTLPAAALPPGTPWVLRHPAADPIPYLGVANLDHAGGLSGGMAYPAPNLAGFLVAVLAHAAINEGVRNAKARKLQQEADRVLAPLGSQLQAYGHGELMRLALEQIPSHGAAGFTATPPEAPGWQVSSVPVFLMTQDRRALLLDNTIGIFPPGETSQPMFAVTVRVVSAPLTESDPLSAWQAGDRLKQDSARLLAHSLVLALRDATRATGDQVPFRTLKYIEGTAEKVERAQPLEAWCQRQVMRTLRGWLLSAPVLPDDGAPKCDPAEFVQK